MQLFPGGNPNRIGTRRYNRVFASLFAVNPRAAAGNQPPRFAF
jgi:hypothetical protein